MLSHNTLIPRDSSANLAPGTIAGIACGAGALFLGAVGLFILYWRRQRQFDREDNFYRSSTEENIHAGAMAPTVSYTMDYKMSPRHHEYAGSSYAYSPEKPTYDFSPLSINETAASAMPTHPAYIPRAMVRGNPTPSTHTRSASSASASVTPQFSHQRPSPPLHNPTPEHFTIHPSPSLHQEPYPSSDSSLGGLPLAKSRQLPPSVPALVIPSSAGSGYTSSSPKNQAPAPRPGGNKPRQYLPPRLNLSGTGSKPLHGKENTTISGPLAFPEHYQPPPQSLSERRRQARQMYDNNDEDISDEGGFPQPQTSGDKRTFRERSTSGSSGREHRYRQRDRDNNRGKKGRNRSNSGTPQQQQTGFAANRHYAEIEVGRDSDIW